MSGAPATPVNTSWPAVVAVAAMVFMTGLDMTIVAVALPDLATDLDTGPSTAQLATLAYLVPLLVFTLPVGRWVDRTRRRTAFLVVVAGFGLSSGLVAMAQTLSLVLAARAVQGMFGAAVGALGFAVISAVVRPEHRGKAQGLVVTVGPLGSVAGPGIGGLLVAAYGWPAAFLVNLPVCALAALIGALTIPRTSPAAMQGASWLKDMGRMLRGHAVVPILLVLLAGSTVTGAYNALLPFLLQDSWQRSAAVAGAVLLVPPAAMVLTAPIGGILTDRWSARRVQLVGASVLVLGTCALFATVLASGARNGTPAVLPALVLVGIAAGLLMAPNAVLLMSTTPRRLAGGAGSVAGLARHAGFALGPAMAALVWQVAGAGVAGTVTGMAIVVLVAVVALAMAVPLSRRPAPGAPPLGSTVTDVVLATDEPPARR